MATDNVGFVQHPDVTPADDAANTASAPVEGYLYLWNGTSWDRQRGNTEHTVFASAARTATPTSTDFTNYNGRTIVVVIDVTAVGVTPSVVFTVQGKDPVSSKYFDLLASAAITGVSTVVLEVGPNITPVANLAADKQVPRVWRVSAVHGNAVTITYSVGAIVGV